MIGLITGRVIFSDGNELILQTNSGIGYQLFFRTVLVEGSITSLFISHVIREASQDLYGFMTLKEKKLFEALTTVKGVGPKSSSSLISSIGSDEVCRAITLENKKILSSAPGIGPKAAAQIVLDLGNKIHKVQMFSSKYRGSDLLIETVEDESTSQQSEIGGLNFKTEEQESGEHNMIDDTIMACKELGFSEAKIVPIIHKIMGESKLNSPEQLVHLVLKEV